MTGLWDWQIQLNRLGEESMKNTKESDTTYWNFCWKYTLYWTTIENHCPFPQRSVVWHLYLEDKRLYISHRLTSLWRHKQLWILSSPFFASLSCNFLDHKSFFPHRKYVFSVLSENQILMSNLRIPAERNLAVRLFFLYKSRFGSTEAFDAFV